MWAKIHKIYYAMSAEDSPIADREAWGIIGDQQKVTGMVEQIAIENRFEPFELWQEKIGKRINLDKL